MSIVTEKNKEEQRFRIFSAVLCAGFFLLFVLADGPVIAKDSPSYMTMNLAREPVYPLFLALFRSIFGEAPGRNEIPVYLYCAVTVQALINAYAVWRVSSTLFGVSRIGAVSSVLFQFTVSLLNRFVAGRGSMYAESVLTESLAMPLYLLFVVRLWELYRCAGCQSAVPPVLDEVRSQKLLFGFPVRHLTGCVACGLLLIGIRKQMTVALLLWGCVSFVFDLLPVLFHRRRDSIKDGFFYVRRFGLTVLLLLLLLACNNLFERTYNRIVHGVFATHTGNSMGLLSTLYYTAEKEDAILFDEAVLPEETRALAKEILDTCYTMGITKQSLEDGTARYYIDTAGKPVEEGVDASGMNLGEHYASSYDIIGYEVCNPVIYRYLEVQGITGIDAQIACDDISSAICRVLLRQKKRNLLQVYAVNLLRGFVSSNARMHRLLVPVSAAFYVLYLFFLWHLRPEIDPVESEAVKGKAGRIDIRLFGRIVLLGLLLNVAVVGAMIFPQARYMIYSMGLFYTALVCMAGMAV